MSDATTGPPEEILCNRFASGEIDTAEYEKPLGVPKGERSIADGRPKTKSCWWSGSPARRCSWLGAAVYAQGQGSSMMGGDNAESGADGMGGMMNGGQMGPMMGGQGAMGSMMDGEGMGAMMGSFDEEQPFDLQFIDQMTMHHEGAIMSSEHMISASERPGLRLREARASPARRGHPAEPVRAGRPDASLAGRVVPRRRAKLWDARQHDARHDGRRWHDGRHDERLDAGDDAATRPTRCSCA